MDRIAKAAKLYAFSPSLIHEVSAKTSAIIKGTSLVTASETRLLFMEMRWPITWVCWMNYVLTLIQVKQ